MSTITTANRNRAADAVAARGNNGSLRIYNGTPPADANAALSGNILLATLPMSASAFGSASSGVATANAITAAVAAATGKPTFARLIESDGTTVVFQCRAALAWLASTAGVAVGDRCTNGGNTYVATTGGTTASSGGPSGTGTGISDGSVVWNYEGPNECALTGGATITIGGNVAVSSLTYTQPA